jgi:MYXO-CTERM domain-containing protein
MLFDGSTVAASTTWDETSIDTRGPNAPTEVEAGPGENQLFVTWKPPVSGDLKGFRIYCDPPPGTILGTPLGTPLRTLQANDGGLALEGGTSAEAGVIGTGGSGPVADSGGSTPTTPTTPSIDPNCSPDTLLVPGAVPPQDAPWCGSASSLATKGTADDLENNQTYAIAVAAIDKVGNLGPLSSVTCSAPVVVDDFYELYRRAGGEGGGGFCSTGTHPHGAWALMALVLGALGLRRRRP